MNNLYCNEDFAKYNLIYKDVITLCRKQRDMHKQFITDGLRYEAVAERFEFNRKSDGLIQRQDAQGHAQAIIEWIGIDEYDNEVWRVGTSLDILTGR